MYLWKVFDLVVSFCFLCLFFKTRQQRSVDSLCCESFSHILNLYGVTNLNFQVRLAGNLGGFQSFICHGSLLESYLAFYKA